MSRPQRKVKVAWVKTTGRSWRCERARGCEGLVVIQIEVVVQAVVEHGVQHLEVHLVAQDAPDAAEALHKLGALLGLVCDDLQGGTWTWEDQSTY